MGQASRVWHLRRFPRQPTRCSMSQPNDSNKSVIPLEQDNPFAKPPAVLGRLKAVERILE